jgi:hypothetical protein
MSFSRSTFSTQSSGPGTLESRFRCVVLGNSVLPWKSSAPATASQDSTVGMQHPVGWLDVDRVPSFQDPPLFRNVTGGNRPLPVIDQRCDIAR